MPLEKITLSSEDNRFLQGLIAGINSNCIIEEKATQIHKAIIEENPSWLNYLYRLKNENIDCVIIENLPSFKNISSDLVKAKILSFALSLIIGEPFQYIQQNTGEITAEVKPLKGYENTVSSGGKIFLGWHTDDCMIEEDSRAKWIQLLGFYNPANIFTNIAFIDDIVAQLSQKSLQILKEQPYKLTIPASFRVDKIWIDVAPIIYLQKNKYQIGVSAYTDIECYNADSEIALNELMNLAEKCKISLNLQPGNAIFFNNNRLLHSREVIPHDRLVLRTYMLPSLVGIQKRSGTNLGRVFDVKNLII